MPLYARAQRQQQHRASSDSSSSSSLLSFHIFSFNTSVYLTEVRDWPRACPGLLRLGGADSDRAAMAAESAAPAPVAPVKVTPEQLGIHTGCAVATEARCCCRCDASITIDVATTCACAGTMAMQASWSMTWEICARPTRVH